MSHSVCLIQDASLNQEKKSGGGWGCNLSRGVLKEKRFRKKISSLNVVGKLLL